MRCPHCNGIKVFKSIPIDWCSEDQGEKPPVLSTPCELCAGAGEVDRRSLKVTIYIARGGFQANALQGILGED